MLSGTCIGETGIACTDEARDRVNVSMIALTTSISRLLMALVFLVSLKNCGYPQLPQKQTGSNADASLLTGKFTKALSLPAVVTSAPKPIPDTYLARLTWVAIDPGRKIPPANRLDRTFAAQLPCSRRRSHRAGEHVVVAPASFVGVIMSAQQSGGSLPYAGDQEDHNEERLKPRRGDGAHRP